MFLLEYSKDGAVWTEVLRSDGGYHTALSQAKELAKKNQCVSRIVNLEMGVLIVNVGPDGLPQGVESGTVT